MPPQPSDSPLGTFFAALREAQIPCILIGNMAAIRQGAPLMTIDYDILERTLRLSRRLNRRRKRGKGN